MGVALDIGKCSVVIMYHLPTSRFSMALEICQNLQSLQSLRTLLARLAE